MYSEFVKIYHLQFIQWAHRYLLQLLSRIKYRLLNKNTNVTIGVIKEFPFQLTREYNNKI